MIPIKRRRPTRRITIELNRFIRGQRDFYLGDLHLGSIIDQRGTKLPGNWGVAWVSGRYDWHNTLQEARDNALKGPNNLSELIQGESACNG